MGDNMNPKIRTYHKQLKQFVSPHKHNVIDKDGNICPTEFVENTMFTGVLANVIRKIDDNMEIYEGDKVKAVYAGHHIYEGIVVFNNGSFSIKTTNAEYDFTAELDNFDSIMIIGNIYDGRIYGKEL